jgi:hypothetical protein
VWVIIRKLRLIGIYNYLKNTRRTSTFGAKALGREVSSEAEGVAGLGLSCLQLSCMYVNQSLLISELYADTVLRRSP